MLSLGRERKKYGYVGANLTSKNSKGGEENRFGTGKSTVIDQILAIAGAMQSNGLFPKTNALTWIDFINDGTETLKSSADAVNERWKYYFEFNNPNKSWHGCDDPYHMTDSILQRRVDRGEWEDYKIYNVY